METLWFCLVAFMFVMYVVLDGFDLGAGALQLLLGRTPEERGAVIRAIGPVWDGNEVWLLAAGGTMYFAFPALYAVSFSGFYLPLMLVLWTLILRGIAVEVRGQVKSDLWVQLWDITFSLSSLLLAVLLGAALGNVMRGVAFNDQGWFFAPLWTNFRVTPRPGILDWYTVVVGVGALGALAMHGALWIALKTEGELEDRAQGMAARLWFVVLTTTAVITFFTLWIQPQVWHRLTAQPWGFLFVVLALAGLGLVAFFVTTHRVRAAFLASCVYLTGMLSSAAFGLYPYVLPSIGDTPHSLTVMNTAASAYGLRVGLAWWIPGMLLVAVYFVYVYRSFAGKLRPEDGH